MTRLQAPSALDADRFREIMKGFDEFLAESTRPSALKSQIVMAISKAIDINVRDAERRVREQAIWECVHVAYLAIGDGPVAAEKAMEIERKLRALAQAPPQAEALAQVEKLGDRGG